MGNRWSWLAAVAGLALALLRLGRLLRPTVEGAPWQIAVVAGAVMGATITWAMRRRWSAVAANLIALLVVTLRIVVPNSLVAGIIPSASTIETLRTELGLGIRIIRTGVAPVSPVAGLVIVLTAVFWALAALAAWGIRNRRPVIALLPPLLFYLQLAVIDQAESEWFWTVAFLGTIALVLLAIARDRQLDSTIRMRSSVFTRAPLAYPALFIASSIVLALGGVQLIGDAIPKSGLVNWRTATGPGNGVLVGVSYNQFTSIRQKLLKPTDTPVFTVRVDGDVDPSTLYWELITLEEFDGENWIARTRELKGPDADTWEDPEMAFFGPTAPTSAAFHIEGLEQNFLPVLYSPTWLGSSLAIFQDSFGVRTDGAVSTSIQTFRGLTYQESALVPQPDVNALASLGGTLTPIFQEAADQGVFEGHAVPAPDFRRPATVYKDDLELPKLKPIIKSKAIELTADGSSPFEKALLLEEWFRDPDNFTYSIDIDPGHSATDLADWLFTTDSPNYRTGYCEQFATAMAVMARTIGIPSRVVTGWGPGQVQADGTIIVRDRNAHAWVELWMPTQGWVRFDPTPGGGGGRGTSAGLVGFDVRAYIPPPPEPTNTTEPGGGATATTAFQPDFGDRNAPIGSGGETETTRTPFFTTTRIVILSLLFLLSIPFLIKAVRRRRRLAKLKRGNISAGWDELIDRLNDLKKPPSPAFTPMEIADDLHRSMIPLAAGVTRARFGPTGDLDGRVVADATRSFIETESYLKTIHPIGERIRAGLGLRSLFRR